MSRPPESAASHATAAMDHARLFFWTSMVPVTAGEVLQNPTETLGPTLPVPELVTKTLQSECIPDMKTTSIMLAALGIVMVAKALHEYPKALVERTLEKLAFRPEQVRARKSIREQLAKVAIVGGGYLATGGALGYLIEYPVGHGTALGVTVALNISNVFHIGYRIRRLRSSDKN